MPHAYARRVLPTTELPGTVDDRHDGVKSKRHSSPPAPTQRRMLSPLRANRIYPRWDDSAESITSLVRRPGWASANDIGEH